MYLENSHFHHPDSPLNPELQIAVFGKKAVDHANSGVDGVRAEAITKLINAVDMITAAGYINNGDRRYRSFRMPRKRHFDVSYNPSSNSWIDDEFENGRYTVAVRGVYIASKFCKPKSQPVSLYTLRDNLYITEDRRALYTRRMERFSGKGELYGIIPATEDQVDKARALALTAFFNTENASVSYEAYKLATQSGVNK